MARFVGGEGGLSWACCLDCPFLPTPPPSLPLSPSSSLQVVLPAWASLAKGLLLWVGLLVGSSVWPDYFVVVGGE
jgi:hypothetical protein